MPRLAAGCGILLIAACATRPETVDPSQEVEDRTGMEMPLDRQPEDAAATPPGVRLEDGLSEDEAAAMALWNSPRLRAELSRLAVARGDLASARRPQNPTLRFLFPSGPQQLSVLLTWPLENLVLLRRRVEVARTDLDVVAQSTVQTAVDLVRDARLAHIDWQLAVDRVEVRRVVAEQADEIAALAQARSDAGDVAPREADVAQVDARVATDEAIRAEVDVAIAEAVLRTQMGWSEVEPSLHPTTTTDEPGQAPPELGSLEELALSSRPDLRASQLAIEAAGQRLGLQRSAVLRFAGVGSSSGPSVTGGVQAELPIFDQNQGGIARAKAELDAATWRYHDLRARIVTEVTQAQLQLARARGSLAEYQDGIVTARERDVEVVMDTYDEGEIDYSGVLLAAQRLELARLREVELRAEARRARVELERALGRRLASPPPPEAP
ncbi:MAG: TolC family protein [Myxococcales bacterium]|nr:TolC family protein [Myxococcales bacterium]